MRPLPTAARPLVASRRLRLTTTSLAVVLVAAAGALVSWRYLFRFPIEPMVDLEVYQRAGEAGSSVSGGLSPSGMSVTCRRPS